MFTGDAPRHCIDFLFRRRKGDDRSCIRDLRAFGDPTATPSARADSDRYPSADPECVPAAGRTVRELPDVVVPEVVVAPVMDGDQKILVEGFTIPAQTIDAGCVVQYDARVAASARSGSRRGRSPT